MPHLCHMTTTLPATLAAAFAEGVATTYWESYQLLRRELAGGREGLLCETATSLLQRMKQRHCTAYEACAQVLPTLEHHFSKRMVMAAAVVVVLGNYQPGAVVQGLPEVL